jgi:hypothetical protein
MGSRGTIMIDVETLLGAPLEDYQTWDYYPQLPKYQNFWSISIQIKGIVLYFSFTKFVSLFLKLTLQCAYYCTNM